jgi:hypothetical protein
MNLPKQAQPVIRQATAAKIIAVGGLRPSGLCQIACNVLPEPLKSICLAAC